MQPSYKADYATKTDEILKSFDATANLQDEVLVIRDGAGNKVASGTTFFGQFGGGCDKTQERTLKIIAADSTKMTVESPGQYDSNVAYVVKAAVPDADHDGQYRALVYLTTMASYEALGEMSICPNTFYAENVTTRNTSFSNASSRGITLRAVLNFDYSDDATYKDINEAIKQLSTDRYNAAYDLLKTVHY